MAGADVGERPKKEAKHGKRRPKRRISIRIDMTPMVDIAFLLLIFYMVTTVFAMPQAMEINLPKEDEKEDVEVKESNLLTIRVDTEGRYWWNLKRVSPDNMPLLLPATLGTPDSLGYVLNADTLRGLLRDQNQLNPKLNTLVKVHRDAEYSDMVNILDEIDVLERSWNAYKAKELGVKVNELTGDDKFSYRYAFDKWEERDDRIIAAATGQATMEGGE